MRAYGPEPIARALMLKFLGPSDYVTPYPRAFLNELEHARSISAALSAPLYEIVELCTSPELPRNLFGFDIGYWGGGNFSILCDAAIWPLWHPPPPAALGELSLVGGDLSEHGLFPTRQSAGRYLEWYRKQEWAETEPSDLKVIAIGSLSAVAG